MVVIHDNLSETHVFFPKHFNPSASGLTLTVKSTVDNTSETVNITDASGLTDFFVVSSSEMPDIPDGEYKYIIKDGEETINSTGLLKKGEWTPDNTQYNINNEYIEYEQN